MPCFVEGQRSLRPPIVISWGLKISGFHWFVNNYEIISKSYIPIVRIFIGDRSKQCIPHLFGGMRCIQVLGMARDSCGSGKILKQNILYLKTKKLISLCLFLRIPFCLVMLYAGGMILGTLDKVKRARGSINVDFERPIEENSAGFREELIR